MSLLAQLLSDLLSLTLFATPAWVCARLVQGGRGSLLESASNALLLTVTLVSIPVFTVALLTRAFIDATWIIAGSLAPLALSLAAFAWRMRSTGGGSGAGGPPPNSPWRAALLGFEPRRAGERVALVAAACVFALYALNYDRSQFQYGCINGVVMQALTPEAATAYDPHGGVDEGAVNSTDWGAPEAVRAPSMGLIDVHGTGQRLGTTAVIAPPVAAFGPLGFRWVYAALPALAMLFGFRLVRHLTGKAGAALGAALVGVLNPYVLKIVILDENVMAFAFGTAFLALLVELRPELEARPERGTDGAGQQAVGPPTPPALLPPSGAGVGVAALSGLAFGAALGIRHVDLGMALTAALLIGLRPRLLVAFGAATVVFALPCALHHHYTYGSVFQHEHFVDEVFAATPHELFGFKFNYTGLFNFPAYAEVIRTPYNPFPTAVYYPINLIAHLGSVLVAVATLGFASLAVQLLTRGRQRLPLALLMWAGPLYALLAVLENWMDPNKMGVVITLFPALVLALGLGFAWVSTRRRVAVLLGLSLALSLGARAAHSWTFPDDPRFYTKYPRVRPELPEYYAFERANVTTGSPLPSLYLLQQYARIEPLARLSGLWGDLVDRRFRRPPPAIEPASGPPVTLALDLARPLIAGHTFASLGPPGAGVETIDASGSDVAVEISGLTAWAPKPLGILVARNGTHEVGVYLRFGEDGFADVQSDRVYSIEQRERPNLERVVRSGSRLALQVRPGDRVKVFETVSLDEVLVYVWEIQVTPTTLEVTHPRRMFHN